MSVKRTLLVTLCLLKAVGDAAADPHEDAAHAARQGDFILMEQRYERILSTNPGDIRALNGKATAQAWRGNYFAAIETFRRALVTEPDNVDSLIGIGYAFSWAGDHGYAIESFEKALSIDPTNFEARKGIAYVSLWSGNSDTARDRFETLSIAHGDDVDLAVALGQANLQEGRARAAIRAFDHALALDPGREDAKAGRQDALGGVPVLEASAWYGSTSDADAGLRLAELGWWAGRGTRLFARYDDSLSLDNRAIISSGDSAETWTGGIQHRFGERLTGIVEAGQRALPNGDEDLVRAELVLHNLPGRLTLGAQLGDHELGYNDDLYYVGFGFPLGERWQLESNSYFSTTGVQQDKEWRSLLNVLYSSYGGWDVVVGAGAGRIDYGGLSDPDRLSVAHAMLTVPIVGFHRAHFAVRHENLPGGNVNIAMLGFTYRLPR